MFTKNHFSVFIWGETINKKSLCTTEFTARTPINEKIYIEKPDERIWKFFCCERNNHWTFLPLGFSTAQPIRISIDSFLLCTNFIGCS
jgi:hypothetical protein